MKLLLLDAACELDELRIPPGNGWKRSRATSSGGTASGSTTSGVSASLWTPAGPRDVEIVDYH